MELTRFDLENQAIQRRIATALERMIAKDGIAKSLERIADALEVLAARFQPLFGEMLMETSSEENEEPAAAIEDILRTEKERAKK